MRPISRLLYRRGWFVSGVLVAGVSLLWVQTALAPPRGGWGVFNHQSPNDHGMQNKPRSLSMRRITSVTLVLIVGSYIAHE